MKKLKHYYNRLWSQILASLLVLLGFSACDQDNSPDNIICMYGTPTASYSIKGKVTDAQGKALPDIRVVLPNCHLYQVPTSGYIPDRPIITVPIHDTLYTQNAGKFEWQLGLFPADTVRFKIQFTDVRETVLPPHFESNSLEVTFIRSDLKNGNGWNTGKAEEEIIVKLREKNEQ